MLCIRSALAIVLASLLTQSRAIADEGFGPPAPVDRPPAIGLFDGLSALDLSSVLGSVLPSEVILGSGFEKSPLASALFDLVKYMHGNVDSRPLSDVEAAIPKYRRVFMFGTWVNENAPADCYDTRAEVMIRDASPNVKVTFGAKNPCRVEKGEWRDPYSNTIHKTASGVDIDHFVPLKNAYLSGAHAWTRERRCHYANFLADPLHLLAVSSHENKVKSDRGPEQYLPPEPTFLCAYVTNWMRIKAIWNMTFTDDEKAAVESVLGSNGCSVTATRPTLREIQNKRTLTLQMNTKCEDPATALP